MNLNSFKVLKIKTQLLIIIVVAFLFIYQVLRFREEYYSQLK